MSANKNTATSLSSEKQQQVEHLLSQSHHIADLLHTSLDAEQAQAALVVINNLSEEAQAAFVKALAKQNETDAADILAGIHALSPSKELRKEARRALLRLEGNKIHAQWTPPITQAPALQVTTSNPPRFWKGVVTQTREEGEIQLLLCWEKGVDYHEVQLFAFLLDFWAKGIKDFIAEVGTKKSINQRIDKLRTLLSHNTVVDCTLAEGKRLLEEALDAAAWRNVQLHEEYRAYLPTLQKLVFQATELGEDRGETYISPDMETQEVIANFLGAWTFGDFGLAYDLLTTDNEIGDHLSRAEWITHHRHWHQESQPRRFELGFIRDLPIPQSTLWLPPSLNKTLTAQKKEVEVGWSVEVNKTPLSGTLKEMPMASVINKETGRHWFWTRYTLTLVNGAWRILQVRDEGLALQGLKTDALEKRITEYRDAIDKIISELRDQKTPTQTESEIHEKFMAEIPWRLIQLLHVHDALITQSPTHYQAYAEAYADSALMGDLERSMIYLEGMVQHSPEQRGENLRRLGVTLAGLAERCSERQMQATANQLLKRADETLREAIEIDHDAASHMLLGELLISQDRHEEGKTELLQAKALPHTDDVETAIEAGLGNIAMHNEDLHEAIVHYQRVCELDPNTPDIWFSLGFAYRLTEQLELAEAAYLHTIELDPANLRAYSELTGVYTHRHEMHKAIDVLNRGLGILPKSAILHALIASVLFDNGNKREALRHLEIAEQLEPELDVVQYVREKLHRTFKK